MWSVVEQPFLSTARNLKTVSGGETFVRFIGQQPLIQSYSLYAICALPQNLQHLWLRVVIKLHILRSYLVRSAQGPHGVIMLFYLGSRGTHCCGFWHICAVKSFACSNFSIYNTWHSCSLPQSFSDPDCVMFASRCITVSIRLVWWRMNVRIQVKRRSHSSTNSSVVLVQRVTASMPPDWPACPKRSSSQVTGRRENSRGAPSASDSSSMYLYICCCYYTSCFVRNQSLVLSPLDCRKICQFAEDATLGNTHFASLVQMLNNL